MDETNRRNTVYCIYRVSLDVHVVLYVVGRSFLSFYFSDEKQVHVHEQKGNGVKCVVGSSERIYNR